MKEREKSIYFLCRKMDSRIYSFVSRQQAAVAACLSSFVLLLVCLLGRPMWETSDDSTVSCLLSGIYGEASPYTLVINYYLCKFFVLLYDVLPITNWLALFEIFSVWISFFIFEYVLLNNSKKETVKYAVLFLFIFEFEFFLKLTYTRSACILSFAGILLIYDELFGRKTYRNNMQENLSEILTGGQKQKSGNILKIILGYEILILSLILRLRLGYTFGLAIISIVLIYRSAVITINKDGVKTVFKRQCGLSLIKIISGCSLFVLGGLFRFDCIYFSIAYIGVLVTNHLIKTLRNKVFDEYRSEYMKLLFIGSALLFTVIFFKLGNADKYNKLDLVNDYRNYNKARSDVTDYLPNEYSDKFQTNKFTISKNDYLMMRYSICNDNYFDKLFFINTKELLNQIEEDTPIGFDNYINRILYCSQGRHLAGKQTTLVIVCVLFMFIGTLFINKENLLSIILNIIGTVAIVIYFMWRGRFPTWVSEPVYLMSCFIICLQICGLGLTKKLSTRTCIWKRTIALMVMVLCMLSRMNSFRIELKNYYFDESLSELFLYATNSDDIFLIDNFSNVPFPIIDVYGMLTPQPKGKWQNLIRVGNWDIKHPVKEAQLRELGINSPISDIMNPKVRLISKLDSYSLDIYVKFFKEHYDMDIEYKEEKIFGNYAIFVFSPKQQIS